MLNYALEYEPECVIRDHLYRVALSEKHLTQLQKTANEYPNYATWVDRDELMAVCGSSSSYGGIELSNGCKAVHVPSYLQGLWRKCQDLSNGTIEWSLSDLTSESVLSRQLQHFDAIILAAGSGLFQSSILEQDDLPIELVRGQAVHLNLKDAVSKPKLQAVLCGKYVTPMLQDNQILVGATQEFKKERLSDNMVIEELKQKTDQLSPFAWEHGEVDKITCGYRVQSHRGSRGRMPIVGRLISCDFHSNAWIFTGLSSRGLVYHGIYGKLLSTAILQDDEQPLTDLLWWKS